MKSLIRRILNFFINIHQKIIKARTAHAREGRRRKTRDGTSNDDIYDEPFSENSTKVLLMMIIGNIYDLHDNNYFFQILA